MMIRGQRGSGIEGGRKSAVNTASSRLCLRLRAVVGGLSILVLVPGVSMAKDFCINFTAFPTSGFVGRGFTVPGKGQCKPFTGFFTAANNSPATGTGCTSTDGSNLSLTILSSEPESPGLPGATFIDSISLSLPSHSGVDNATQDISTGAAVINTFDVTGAACSKVVIPAVEPETAPLPGAPHSPVR